MRWLINALVCGVVAMSLAACGSSSDADADTAPKGGAPDTVQAPEGAKNPEERGMEEQRAQQGGGANGQFGSDQDGGGQDGK